MIHVVWLPPDNQWDEYTFELLFNNKMWLPNGSYEFKHHKDFSELPKEAEGIILVVPQKYYVDKVDWLNDKIKHYKYVLYVGSGNEEAEFPIEKIKHPNMVVYYTTPHMKRTKFKAIDRLFGDGYAPQSECIVDYAQLAQDKPIDVYFGGQVTHERREQAMKALKHIDTETKVKVEYLESKGFTQGYDDYHTYYEKMASAKIVPCPSGPNTPDTFRNYEALEAMALPILDTKTIYDSVPDYWSKLFGAEPPVPIIKDDWESLNGYCQGILEDWHTYINRAVSWWIGKKKQYAYDLVADLDKLTGYKKELTAQEKITVIVLTSPIPSNPDTRKIDECIASIRTVLPEAEILIGVDGVREEQLDRKPDYQEFTKRLLWNCLHVWTNVLPVVFEEHMHQAMMTKKLLTMVKTPTILFVEHDMVITSKSTETQYPPYEWGELVDIIEEGTANIIRFHFEAVFPVEHLPLMLGEREYIHGIPMIKTIQYSQRPFLANTAFYKDIIDRYFTDESRTFIEDVVHGKPISAYQDNGIVGWNLWKIWIYAPEGDMKRSETIDGREDDPKYEMRF